MLVHLFGPQPMERTGRPGPGAAAGPKAPTACWLRKPARLLARVRRASCRTGNQCPLAMHGTSVRGKLQRQQSLAKTSQKLQLDMQLRHAGNLHAACSSMRYNEFTRPARCSTPSFVLKRAPDKAKAIACKSRGYAASVSPSFSRSSSCFKSKPRRK